MSQTATILTLAPGFEPVAAAFQKHLDEGLELGAGFCARVEGQTVVDLVGGHADRARTRPWTAETLVPVYSTSKPIAAMTLARLADQGLLDFDEPIGRLWPEFAAHGKPVTIAEALSHQAGVPGFPDPIDPDLWLDHAALAPLLAAQAPLWRPGGANGYHPITYGVIANELALRACGRTIGAHLKAEVCGPQDIDFWIGLPDVHHVRCAEMMKPRGLPEPVARGELHKVAFLKPWSAPSRGGADWRRTEMPAANAHGTARSLATLYDVFADEGRIGGREMVSRRALKDLTAPRIEGRDLVLEFDVRRAAGPMINAHGAFGPNPHGFGHPGRGGASALADPDARLSAAYVMNRQSMALIDDPRPRALIAALYACL
jgi:CubicO group peptidase (beta-lactamase class C family)